MCGFVGEVNNRGAVDRITLDRMSSRIAHRGPDAHGFYADQQGDFAVGLDSRRLKIIDLSAMGDMPMSNADGSIWLAYNGEIYNHMELRRELEARGCRYRSATDSETVIYAYQEYGLDALSRFNGIFSFALYDQRSHSLVLARDRMGVKPLYYYWDGERLVFGSELKAMLAHPAIDRRVDRQAVDLFLSFGYVPAPYSMIGGIRKLEAGQTLTLEDGAISCRYFWQPRTQPGAERASGAELAARTRTILEEVVQSQMMSDVPVGTLLSGGLDSSIVTALAARNHDGPIDTFSVGFAGKGEILPDPSYNEDLSHAREVAHMLGTRHHEVIVRPSRNLTSLIGQLAEGLDEPVWEGSYISIYLMAEAAREQGVKVLLTGDGGDELFAGYPWYEGYRRLVGYKPFQPLVGLLHSVAEGHLLDHWPEQQQRIRTVYQMLRADEVGRYRLSHDIFSAAPKHALQNSAGVDDMVADVLLRGLLMGSRGSSVDKVGLLDTALWLREHFSQRLDRMTMLNSIEARVPLQDNRLVDFALSLSHRQKMPGGQLKHLLRVGCADLLPPSVISRPKRPFAVPGDWWLQNALSEFALDTLAATNIERWGLLDGRRVEQLARDYILRGQGSSAQIWALLNLQLWCDACLNEPQTEPSLALNFAPSAQLVGAAL